MYIKINVSQDFRVEKAFNDLLCIISQVKKPREVVTNPNVGELALISPGTVITPEYEKEFWARVADAIEPYYDVIVTDTEFTLLDKSPVTKKKSTEKKEVKAEVKKEEKKEENSIIKRAKRLFKKSGKKDI